MPSPEPLSGNCDVVSIWDGNQKEYTGSNEKVKQANSSTVDLNPNIDEEIVEQAQDLIAEEPTSEVTIEEVPTDEKAPQTTVVEDSTTSPQDVVDDSILKEKAEPDNNDELITVVPTT